MELVLQADWQAVQRPHDFAIGRNVFVQLLSPMQGLVEEDFMKAVVLV
jgi:hypothetical protein